MKNPLTNPEAPVFIAHRKTSSVSPARATMSTWQTSGGVINYLSTPNPTRSEGFLRTSYGTDHELRNHLYFGDVHDSAAGWHGYLIEYYDRRTEGFKTIDGAADFTATDRTGFRKREPMLKLFWEPLAERYQRFELKLGYTDLVAYETYMGLSDADFSADPYRRYAGSRFDRIDTEQFRSHLRHQMEVTPELRLTTTAYYHTFERDWCIISKPACAFTRTMCNGSSATTLLCKRPTVRSLIASMARPAAAIQRLTLLHPVSAWFTNLHSSHS